MDFLDKFTMENLDFPFFLQSGKWANFQKSIGKKVFVSFLIDTFDLLERIDYSDCVPEEFLKSFPKEKILISSLLLEENLPRIGKFLYSPRGPVFKRSIFFDNLLENPIEKFLMAIRDFGRKQGYIFVRMEPPYEFFKDEVNLDDGTLSSDKDSFLVYKKILESIKAAGFKASYKKQVQPFSTSLIDLKKSENEIIRSFHQKTRYNVKLSERKGIKVYALSFGEKFFGKDPVDIFYEILLETKARDKIHIYSKEYYSGILKNFGESAKIFIASFEENPLVANLCIGFGKIFTYLHGGSKNEMRNLMPAFLAQWEQIKFAKKFGFEFYDFWGVDRFSEFPNWAGITRFKRGFSGSEITFFFPFDFPFKSFLYNLLKIKAEFPKNR